MKHVMITTALAACLAVPALAQSQLERQLHVETGRYTTHQLAVLTGKAQETGAEGRVFFDETGDVVAARAVAVRPAARDSSDLRAPIEGTAATVGSTRAGGVTYSASGSQHAPAAAAILDGFSSHGNGSNS